ncbi:MAG: protease pro-enzyme activation domain-containing protein, partial [Gammaproteobacteria bacterium]
ADMAYDDVTGMLWQLSVDQPAHFGDVNDYSHIYELDPKTMMPTGKSILVPSAQSEFGLAFDPVSGTWYAGDFNSEAIYRFDATGTLLSSVRVGLPIGGLAYNPGTGHLFVLTHGGDHAVYVLDAKHDYSLVKTFDIPGFNPQNSGAGLGYDCAGHLWISDYVDRVVFEVASGETGWCSIKYIPWLTLSPATGTLAAGASAAVTLDFDGAGQSPFTTSQVQLKLSGSTPYPVRTIPLVVHWDPQPVNLAITGSVAPNPVNKGGTVAYTLTVKNRNAANQGSATETFLTYQLPAGANYVSGGGEGIVCSASSPGSSAAPAEASAPATGTVSCTLGTLSPGNAKMVTLVVKPGLAGTLSSTFDVDAREPESGSVTTRVTLASTVTGVADLSASAQDLKLTEGKTGTLHFTVANAGPDPATKATFRLSSGSGVKLSSANPSRGSCETAGSNGFNCDFGDLDSGASATVDLEVLGTDAGSTTVTGRVATTATDPTAGNEVALATVTVVAASGGGTHSNKSGGGGGFTLYALLSLLGLVFASLFGQRLATASDGRSSRVRSFGETMIGNGKTFLSTVAITVLAILIGFGLTSVFSPAQARTPEKAQSGQRSGLTSSGVAMAQRDLAPDGFVSMSLQSVPAVLKQATKLGAHDPSSKITLTVSLKLRNTAKLTQFLQELHDPRSPSYRQFLTPAEFTAEYGPASTQVAAVEKYLKGYGIKVKDVSPNRLLIHTEGTTVAYENALGVQINDYRMNGRGFFSTSDRPKLPVAIAGFVQNVIGLNNAVRMRPRSHIKPLALGAKASGGPAASRSAANDVPAPPPQSSAYYNPLQIGAAYDWPSITGSDDGSGVTIAILTAASSNLQASDYAGFWNAFGLPDHTVNLIDVDGDKNLTNGMVETLLDMEWSGAMAPGATLDVYIGDDPALTTFIDVYSQFVTDDNAQVMTTSWGAPETSWGTLAQTADNIFAEAAAQGISMFAAAGDNGSGDGTGFPNMADFPSVDPYITAANGTELYANAEGNYLSETAWSDTGGAISQIFSEPTWQTGPGVPQNGWRNNSDLSMNAGPARPYLFLYGGRWTRVWGTSAVAPQLAALFAIGIWQNDGNSLGQSNELIYADVNAGNYASDFHDVTMGSNGAYDAGLAWDHPTGWGSP